MKWVNVGTHVEWDIYSNVETEVNNTKGTETGFDILASSNNKSYLLKKLDEEIDECWLSFNIRNYQGSMYPFYAGFDSTVGSNTIPLVCFSKGTQSHSISIGIVNEGSFGYEYLKQLIYTPDKTTDMSDNKIHNVEIHLKTGTNGRIDLWFDHKLICSYRSPTTFADMKISYAKFLIGNYSYTQFSSFIIQDTRRIGYEKFVKLNIDPDTEQNMPQGSTTNFTLSGLSDSAEYSDITGVCAVLQATSRDANITTGTYTLDGADVGTIDVSDSSGQAYETAYAETNNVTGLPWTRDDIEGKTLSFTVNGAS